MYFVVMLTTVLQKMQALSLIEHVQQCKTRPEPDVIVVWRSEVPSHG
jgi:hypothetical protein